MNRQLTGNSASKIADDNYTHDEYCNQNKSKDSDYDPVRDAE